MSAALQGIYRQLLSVTLQLRNVIVCPALALLKNAPKFADGDACLLEINRIELESRQVLPTNVKSTTPTCRHARAQSQACRQQQQLSQAIREMLQYAPLD